MMSCKIKTALHHVPMRYRGHIRTISLHTHTNEKVEELRHEMEYDKGSLVMK
jgi:hypothetical protein